MSLFVESIGRVVSPCRMLTSPNKGVDYAQMIIDFGSDSKPDHWYCSAWEDEIIESAKKLKKGQSVQMSGSIRKWTGDNGVAVTINLESIVLMYTQRVVTT